MKNNSRRALFIAFFLISEIERKSERENPENPLKIQNENPPCECGEREKSLSPRS
jgi:hypothetical protein